MPGSDTILQSWFPFRITNWKLVSLAAASFGLNQKSQTFLAKVSIRMETQECWRKTSRVGSRVCHSSSHVLLVELLPRAAHLLCWIWILRIRGCSKWILLSQMPEGFINQRETGVFPVQGSIFCSNAIKNHNALSRLANRRVSSLHKRVITGAQMSASDPASAGVNLGLFSLPEELAGFRMLLWLSGSPRKPRCQLLRFLSWVLL